jgi:hypothetical protein
LRVFEERLVMYLSLFISFFLVSCFSGIFGPVLI